MLNLTVDFPITKRLYLKRKVKIADNWKEAGKRQLMTLAMVDMGKIGDDGFIHFYTRLPKKIIKRLGKYQKLQLIRAISKIHESQGISKFLLRRVKIKGLKLWGPARNLKNVTFAQFIYAEGFFQDAVREQNPESLNKFVACLYLKKREKFDEKLIDGRAKRLHKRLSVEKMAILMNYRLLHKWLTVAFPLLFQEAEKQSNGNKNKKDGYDPRGWVKLFDKFVGDDIVNEDKYADMPAPTVFRKLNNRIKEQSKRK